MSQGESPIVSRIDLRGVITYVNGDFIEASGYTEKELLGQPYEQAYRLFRRKQQGSLRIVEGRAVSGGLWSGIRQIFARMTIRGRMVSVCSVVVVGVFFVFVQWPELMGVE